jgi:hypothetical protein
MKRLVYDWAPSTAAHRFRLKHRRFDVIWDATFVPQAQQDIALPAVTAVAPGDWFQIG